MPKSFEITEKSAKPEIGNLENPKGNQVLQRLRL
jgi:hypothetical protein